MPPLEDSEFSIMTLMALIKFCLHIFDLKAEELIISIKAKIRSRPPLKD
jgi:hypothetical protein